MNKIDAQKLVGSTVTAWTASNGTYSGILEEVIVVPRSPWRAKIRITSIFTPAQHFECGRVVRRGFRTGEIIEIGGANMGVMGENDSHGFTSYVDALLDTIAKCQCHLDRLNRYDKSISIGTSIWAMEGTIGACKQKLAEEVANHA